MDVCTSLDLIAYGKPCTISNLYTYICKCERHISWADPTVEGGPRGSLGKKSTKQTLKTHTKKRIPIRGGLLVVRTGNVC